MSLDREARMANPSGPTGKMPHVAFSEKRFGSAGGRRMLGLGVLVVLVLAALLGSFLYDQSRGDLIAPGVTVAGVEVGGLRAPAARARLDAELRAERARVIAV